MTRYEWIDRALLTWEGDRLVTLEVLGAIVVGDVIDDPLLGRAHAIDLAAVIDPRDPDMPPAPYRQPRRRATTMSAINWARPTEIPAIAAPAALPPGAGSAIMNVLATLAQRASVPALRYAGPYPTHALWSTLLRSFTTSGTVGDFTAHALDRAARLARDPIAIDFIPAPHTRLDIPRGHVELREGAITRAVIDGASYEPGGMLARLVPTDDGARAELPHALIATFSPDGTVVDGPHPVPPYPGAIVGAPFPPPLRDALAELVAELVAAPLADDARQVLSTRTLAWADLGARAAVRTPDGFAVHAALWDRLAPSGLASLAIALAEALAPVVAAAVIADVTRAT